MICETQNTQACTLKAFLINSMILSLFVMIAANRSRPFCIFFSFFSFSFTKATAAVNSLLSDNRGIRGLAEQWTRASLENDDDGAHVGHFLPLTSSRPLAEGQDNVPWKKATLVFGTVPCDDTVWINGPSHMLHILLPDADASAECR